MQGLDLMHCDSEMVDQASCYRGYDSALEHILELDAHSRKLVHEKDQIYALRNETVQELWPLSEHVNELEEELESRSSEEQAQ